MRGKLSTTAAKILLTLLTIQMIICIIPTASAATPTKLKIFIGPTNIPADSQTYECISIQLQDAKGNPARATEDVIISLTSSLTNVGNVANPTVTIKKGSTFATTQFQTTFTPGTTTISATASSYPAVQATLTSVGPIPSTIVVYGYPLFLPADSKSYDGTVVVQLQDSSGSPAKAPNEGVQVALSSSNTTVGIVDESVTIPGGSTHAMVTFTTTNAPGKTSITAVSSGFTSKQVTFTTKTPDSKPTELKIYLGPPKVPADDMYYRNVAVMLQTSSGIVAVAPEDLEVTLASSEESVGTVEKTIVIPQGESYALANFDATYKPGKTTITAVATDCKSTQETITTFGVVPSEIGVFCIPSALPADSGTYNTIQVQLQDSSGKPAKDPDGDVTINLFSSQSECGSVTSIPITIPFGQTQTSATFTSAFAANLTTITAQASGYTTGQTKVTTHLIDEIALSITLTGATNTIKPGSSANITAYVTYAGVQPASGVTVAFSGSKGATNFSKVTYQGEGKYFVVFTPSKNQTKALYTIFANATKSGYLLCEANTTINVGNELDQGIIQIHLNQDDNPISEASIISITQPSGSRKLNGVTNQTGDCTFKDLASGTYIFEISKPGYETAEYSIVLGQGKTITRSVSLVQESSPIWIIVAVVVAAVVSSLLGFFFFRRRRKRKMALKNEEQK